MRRNLIVAVTLLLAACAPQEPATPGVAVDPPTGVQPLGEFITTVNMGDHGLMAQITLIADASDNLDNQNPLNTLELFSNAAFTVVNNNSGGTCRGFQTVGAPVTLKNYTLDELRQVHLQFSYTGINNDACTASNLAPPVGSPATGGLGYYYYPNLVHGTASKTTAGMVDNSDPGQSVQWDFLYPTLGASFVVRGQVYAERWPAAPVLTVKVNDIQPTDGTFAWTTDLSVTKTRLEVHTGVSCTTSPIQATYDVTTAGSNGSVNTYSQVVPLGATQTACILLKSFGYTGANEFLGSLTPLTTYLRNYPPPAIVAPAASATVATTADFSWTAHVDAGGVTAWICPGVVASGAACVAAGTPHDVAAVAPHTGNFTLHLTGMVPGTYSWTLVARNYSVASGANLGTAITPQTFTVQ